MTSHDKILYIAAQVSQLQRELEAMAAPTSRGGIPLGDVSISASHAMIVAASYLQMSAMKLIAVADTVKV